MRTVIALCVALFFVSAAAAQVPGKLRPYSELIEILNRETMNQIQATETKIAGWQNLVAIHKIDAARAAREIKPLQADLARLRKAITHAVPDIDLNAPLRDGQAGYLVTRDASGNRSRVAATLGECTDHSGWQLIVNGKTFYMGGSNGWFRDGQTSLRLDKPAAIRISPFEAEPHLIFFDDVPPSQAAAALSPIR
jgi:hypothetical protein